MSRKNRNRTKNRKNQKNQTEKTEPIQKPLVLVSKISKTDFFGLVRFCVLKTENKNRTEPITNRIGTEPLENRTEPLVYCLILIFIITLPIFTLKQTQSRPTSRNRFQLFKLAAHLFKLQSISELASTHIKERERIFYRLEGCLAKFLAQVRCVIFVIIVIVKCMKHFVIVLKS